MATYDFSLTIGDGFASVRLFQAPTGEYGLTLHDGSGRPCGKGRALSVRQAQELARALDQCRTDGAKLSVLWACLGYGRRSFRAIASGMCHPGALRLHGRAG